MLFLLKIYGEKVGGGNEEDVSFSQFSLLTPVGISL